MYSFQILHYQLNFAFLAKTSRDALTSKSTWLVKISNGPNIGWGECNTIRGLSVDGHINYSSVSIPSISNLNENPPSTIEEVYQWVNKFIPIQFPALRMGFETAWLDLIHGSKFKIFDNEFYQGTYAIPINGLVWMNDIDEMLQQVHEKIEAGFSCIKLKIGAHDFQKEVALIDRIRTQFSDKKLTLRLDANGAFSDQDALPKLDILSKYDIHSIEQPMAIRSKQLNQICKDSPIKIALDEELIGVISEPERGRIMDAKPDFIILKPSLLGGFNATADWIKQAEEAGIGWWITSALESSVGLNAIAQFTADYQITLPQGLGTGKIYKNNIESPLEINGETLRYNPLKLWKTPQN